jgi:hypothetical protein
LSIQRGPLVFAFLGGSLAQRQTRRRHDLRGRPRLPRT